MSSNSPEILGEALRLAAAGRPVFPCKRTKAPYTRQGFKDATTNADIIARWWTQWPDANIGYPTGNGIVVIDTDLDDEAGKDGEFELIGMPDLPPTYKVRTPRGGYHRYYRTPGGMVMPNSSDKLANGIDVRGDGGYVLAPPSATDKGEYIVAEDVELAVLPDEWVDLIMPSEPVAKESLATQQQIRMDQPEVKPWDDFRDRVTWFEILAPHGWSRGKTNARNTEWMRPGKDAGVSATTKGEDGPFYVFSTSTQFDAGRAYSKQYVYAQLNHGGDMSAAMRTLALRGYGSKPNANALDISAHKKPEEPATPVETTDYWTLSKLRGYTVDPADWFVGHGWMRRGAVTLMVGMTGIGKSVLATQMAATMATGSNILGKLEVPRPLKVLVVQAENDPDVMKRDLTSVVDALNLDEDLMNENLRMYHKPGLTPMMLAGLIQTVHTDWPYDMVFVDNYMSYCGGDINSTETFFDFRNAIESPLVGMGVGCMLLTHPPKPPRGEATPRHHREVVYNAAGTSALANWVRTSCELALAGQEDKRCILRFAKNAERTGLKEPTGDILRKLYLERSDAIKPYWRIADSQAEAATGQFDEALEAVWRDDPTLSVRDAANKVGCSKSTASNVYARLKPHLQQD